MRTLLDILRIIRIENCLLSAAGVAVGAVMTWVEPIYYPTMMAALAAFFVCAFGNVVNDLVDIDVDRVCHPNRPLAAGRMSRRMAAVIGSVSALAALGFGYSAGGDVFVVVIAAMLILLAYNYRLKRWPVAGNVTVAFLSGMTFIVGGLAVDRTLTMTLPGPIVAAALAFMFHLVREIIKDVEDMDGDRQRGYNSLAILIGPSRSLMVALALSVPLLLLALIPVWEGWLGRAYEILGIYIVMLPTMAFLIFVWAIPRPVMIRTASFVLKVGMIVGLVGILAGLN